MNYTIKPLSKHQFLTSGFSKKKRSKKKKKVVPKIRRIEIGFSQKSNT